MVLERMRQALATAFVESDRRVVTHAIAGEGRSGTRLAAVTMAFGLGTALGPHAASFLVGYGVVVPFAVGAVLGVCAFVLVYTGHRDHRQRVSYRENPDV